MFAAADGRWYRTVNIEGHEIVGHDGHNVAVHESKTTGIPHIVCHSCQVSLVKLQPCEVYSRCVGYLRPVSSWNLGKKQEFKERKVYIMPTDEALGGPDGQ